jgi:ribonuclease P protein component
VIREGKRFRTAHLEARMTASPRCHPRLGFIVPRHRHTAVERNRLKRRLRELARTRLLPNLPAVDLVVRARPSAYALSFESLAAEMTHLSTQAPRGDTSS